MLDILDFLISHYNPNIEQAVLPAMPKESGKKPGHQTRKRKSQSARDTRGWDDIESTQTNNESSIYRVVFVRSTKATTCYGCEGKVRDKPSSDPPPAPYDIFLCRYERQVYHKKGRFSQSTTLNTTTQKHRQCTITRFRNVCRRNLVGETLTIFWSVIMVKANY